MKLSTDKSFCVVGERTLRLEESIDYKGAAETKASIGRIKEFREVEPDSVWMNIADMGRENTTEWISVAVWNENFNQLKPKEDARIESAPVEDLPF